MTFQILLLVAVAGFASWALTGAVRRYMVARRILDQPNERSAHTVPTPRGGGLGIAVVVLGGIVAGVAFGWLGLRPAAALGVGAALVAGAGWVDDHRNLPARTRFLVQLASAGLAVALLGGVATLRLGSVTLSPGLPGAVIAAIGIVAATNFYNFMDGIDGIAAGEAVVAGLAGGLLLARAGAPDLAGVSFLVSAASFGFLLWNRPPARIFMGDVGSGLLGFLFGVLGIASEVRGAVPLLAWLLLLGVFWVDPMLTLAGRVSRREPWLQAHNKHCYQRAVRAGASHGAVTGAVLLVDVGLAGAAWLLTVAAPPYQLPIFALSVAALVAIYALTAARTRPLLAPPAEDERQPRPVERERAGRTDAVRPPRVGGPAKRAG